jgi:hypothetical protein
MDFTKFESRAEWTDALEQIIILARNAISNNNQIQIDSIQDILREYQEKSPLGLEDLDLIASQILMELNGDARRNALRNLENIASEVKGLGAVIQAITDDAEHSSKDLQLKVVKEFLTKTKTSINILKSFRDDISNDTTNLGQTVKAVFNAIKAFEEAFPDE